MQLVITKDHLEKAIQAIEVNGHKQLSLHCIVGQAIKEHDKNFVKDYKANRLNGVFQWLKHRAVSEETCEQINRDIVNNFDAGLYDTVEAKLPYVIEISDKETVA